MSSKGFKSRGATLLKDCNYRASCNLQESTTQIILKTIVSRIMEKSHVYTFASICREELCELASVLDSIANTTSNVLFEATIKSTCLVHVTLS